MEDKNQITEMELPQIRQKVLENTRRINRNELEINKLRMEQVNQTRKSENRLDACEEDRKAAWAALRRANETLDRIGEKQDRYEEERRKSREDWEKQMAESDARAEERHREFEDDLKKSRTEFDNRMKDLDEKISRLTTDFIGSIGHIIEGLAGTKAEEMFTAQGYEISDKKRNVHKKIKILNKEMEADVVLLGENIAIVIEVKANCTRKDIDKFVNHMKNRFRDLFPEWNNLEILGAVAAINYEDDADAYAHQNGLLVIRTDTRNVFSLDKTDRETH
jgi:hypothetical protein